MSQGGESGKGGAIDIKVGKTYTVGRARYRVVRIESGEVRVNSAGFTLTYPQERFQRMIERGAAAKVTRRARQRSGS